MKRRTAITSLAMAAGAGLVNTKSAHEPVKKPISQRINHSVCRWCYNKIPLEELADRSKDIGLSSVELLWPEEWDVVISRGLSCAISFGSKLGIEKGFNDPQYHAQLHADFKALIPKAADAGLKQVICFSGNRNGKSEQEGLENCAVGVEPVVKIAEKHNIIVSMELLNSKVNHKDYQCDKTPWGVSLVEKVGSPNFKLLYDIYHMQIMEGDVIRTIRQYGDYISHYHTGGVPGRNEINESQELYYPAIMKAIADLDYEGFVGQEFIPTRNDPFVSLAEGVTICDV